MITHEQLQKPKISDSLKRSNVAFDRDLPGLMENGYVGWWVAYVNGERVALAEERGPILKEYGDKLRAGDALVIQVKLYPKFEASNAA